ncbi:MAG: T9SS type A sorting domain-containing protein [Flavobacteriales bacterium]|nr:T9SS type A sorting domain-containing protein [Flavobacteriales bacterium]
MYIKNFKNFRHLFFICIGLWPVFGQAQKTTVIGSVYETGSKKIVPFATVAVTYGDSIVAVCNSNHSGFYELKFHINDSESKYRLQTSHGSYQTSYMILQDLIFESKNTIDIKLSPKPPELEIVMDKDEEERKEFMPIMDSSPKYFGITESADAGIEYDRSKKGKSHRAFSTTRADIDAFVTEESGSVALGFMGDMPSSIIAEAKISELKDLNPKGNLKNELKAGVLTAGKIHDFSKWNLWEDISENDLKAWKEAWQVKPEKRFTLQLSSESEVPIVDATVQLMNSSNELVWETRTDNTGKAECWANILDQKTSKSFHFLINHGGKEHRLDNAKEFHKKINTLKINTDCTPPNTLDIMFVVDATGSMGDEIGYLKTELNDVIKTAQSNQKDLQLRMGSIFYRDHGDEYVTRKSPFSNDINKTTKFIKEQSANGGGDFPEAVTDALEDAIYNSEWSQQARSRLLFLVLDAPPHNSSSKLEKLHKQIKKAAQMGIQIVPLSGSGIDKSTEYLMRAMALATNGTYMFLTNHSGVGGHHVEPTTDKFDTEFLNEMLIEFIENAVFHPGCKNEALQNEIAQVDSLNLIESEIPKEIATEVQDTSGNSNSDPDPTDKPALAIQLKAFPNPSRGLFTVSLSEALDELFVADITGKLITKRTQLRKGNNEFDLTDFPSGIYYLIYQDQGMRKTFKIILSK